MNFHITNSQEQKSKCIDLANLLQEQKSFMKAKLFLSYLGKVEFFKIRISTKGKLWIDLDKSFLSVLRKTFKSMHAMVCMEHQFATPLNESQKLLSIDKE